MADQESEIMFGAVHEAGHVAMYLHYGIPVSGFMVDSDGLGEVRGGPYPTFDIDVIVDTNLAGPAAEGKFRQQDQCPDSSQVELVLDTIQNGDEDDDPDDYSVAVELIHRNKPDWDIERITHYLRCSYERCERILAEDWERVMAMAMRAAAMPGEYVDPGEFA